MGLWCLDSRRGDRAVLSIRYDLPDSGQIGPEFFDRLMPTRWVAERRSFQNPEQVAGPFLIADLVGNISYLQFAYALGASPVRMVYTDFASEYMSAAGVSFANPSSSVCPADIGLCSGGA